MLDLLIVGGLTVDHLPDGSTTAGGTVMHAAGAIAARGLRIGIVTAAGAEPEAQAGLAELRRAAQIVACRPLDHSVTFRHVETVAGRTLWLERIGGSVEVDADLRHRIHPRAVLFGPVLEEVPVAALDAWDEAVASGAILQGWLRSGDEGAEVRPRPLAALGSAVLDALASLDLLVASREDLVAEAEAPREQLAALRRAFGARPHLIVTDGAGRPLARRGARRTGEPPLGGPATCRNDLDGGGGRYPRRLADDDAPRCRGWLGGVDHRGDARRRRHAAGAVTLAPIRPPAGRWRVVAPQRRPSVAADGASPRP